MSQQNPLSSIALFTFTRTYARRVGESDYVETWEQCIERVVDGCNQQLGVGFDEGELKELYSLMYNLKCSVAGRFLWQLGTEMVPTNGLTSLMNCAFRVIDKPIAPFAWVMEFLMCGSGCGFRLLPSDLEKFPKILPAKITRLDTNDADFIVPDSRQGWVKLLKKVLRAHFKTGADFTYSCILIRSKGAKIKKFGGTASGPDILCKGVEEISKILNNRVGESLHTIDTLDIMNNIGYIVVAGNVRRSAQIALGDVADAEFLRAKRWDLGSIPNTRSLSNNSIICNDIKDIINNDEFWTGYNGNGEPYGLVNLRLARSCGRLGDTEYTDPTVEGCNPCAEQPLANCEVCCLSEIYLPNIASKEELKRCAVLMYRINKHALRLPCPASADTERVVRQNMRMGIGVTGYMQATDEQKSWLSPVYEYLRGYDVVYSEEKGFPISVKLTTVKPSGTLSLIAGCTSGIHPGFAHYYIRRIRIASSHALVKVAAANGYNMEYVRNFDGTLDHNTMVVEFPCSLPPHTKVVEQCSAIQQLEAVKEIQTNWSDNAVSCTVYYHKEELPIIKEWLLENYNNSVKSVSFLLHSEHGFDQAPLEEITKERYEEMVAKCKPITDLSDICYPRSTIDEDEDLPNDCVGGGCPIR